jgi:hypothetical protein
MPLPTIMIVKHQRRKTRREIHDDYVAAMWLMFLRCPSRPTAPGEPVDLGELGSAPEKNWTRLTPYSLARPGGSVGAGDTTLELNAEGIQATYRKG